jgi:16S rRNA (cytidine1402-2'-O)-methyltransferase
VTNKLAVVCTPIGNLADLSPRATTILNEASLVLCEDTRHSRPLLERVGSSAKLVSCHAHNERERKELVVSALESGERVALITDAGAPGLSDPGGRIIEEIIAAGREIEVLPGPTALTAALMGAGFDINRFAFLGFLPRRGGARTSLLGGAVRAGFGVVVYEAPQRTPATLADLFAVFGARRVVVARELTKLHETFHRGVLGPADDGGATALTPPLVEKGEVVIVVEAGSPKAAALEGEDVDAIARDDTLTPKDRARRIAKVLGIPVREAYARVQQAGDDVETKLGRARDLLASAASALVQADDLVRVQRGLPRAQRANERSLASEIPGADALMELLARQTSLRAPVEGQEAARAMLASIAALDALIDALAYGRVT